MLCYAELVFHIFTVIPKILLYMMVFLYEYIPIKIQNPMVKNSYKENEYVKFEDLKLCKVLYIGFDGKEHEIELIIVYKVESPING